MAGTIVADQLEAASTSTLVIKNGVANTPPTIQDSAGTQIGTFCRAWVNFNGTGTVAIRASFNVSSITDNGTGDYTVNFTTAMPDANYSVAGAGRLGDSATSGAMRVVSINSVGNLSSAMTVSSIRIATQYANAVGGAEDIQVVCVSVFR